MLHLLTHLQCSPALDFSFCTLTININTDSDCQSRGTLCDNVSVLTLQRKMAECSTDRTGEWDNLKLCHLCGVSVVLYMELLLFHQCSNITHRTHVLPRNSSIKMKDRRGPSSASMASFPKKSSPYNDLVIYIVNASPLLSEIYVSQCVLQRWGRTNLKF